MSAAGRAKAVVAPRQASVGAAMRGSRLASHNAAQSGLGGCARLLARSEVASWLPWLLAVLVVMLWATYPSWFYVGLSSAPAAYHSLEWVLAYIGVRNAVFGVRWLAGRPRYPPAWSDVRHPLFWGGSLLFMTNAGLFSLALSALLALATGQAGRLRSFRFLVPVGLLLVWLAFGARSVGGGFPAGRDLAIAIVGHVCAAAAGWGSVWASRVGKRMPERTYSATVFWIFASGVSSLVLTVAMVWLAGFGLLPAVGVPFREWASAAGAALATGLGDSLYRRAL